jgi:hypothetical protein
MPQKLSPLRGFSFRGVKTGGCAPGIVLSSLRDSLPKLDALKRLYSNNYRELQSFGWTKALAAAALIKSHSNQELRRHEH